MQSAFPKLLFIQNRMKIERLIEEGLLLGRHAARKVDSNAVNGDDVADDESLHLHGHAMRLDAEEEGSSTADERDGEAEAEADPLVTKRSPLQDQFRENRSSSLLTELKRQSGVFFDDPVRDGEDGDSESEVEEWASALGYRDEDSEEEHEKMN